MLQNYLNCISYIDSAITIPTFLGPNHNNNLINPNTITLYILDPKFCPTKGDLVSRYLFVFNSPHLSRACLIGIRNMIRGGSPNSTV